MTAGMTAGTVKLQEKIGMSDVARAEDGTWKPGVSGNQNGRPVGSRNKFSDAMYRDVGAAWAKHGATVLDRVAATEPAKFFSVCAALVPKDVSLTLQTRLPGGLEPDDWQIVNELLEAVRQGMPDAGDREPGEVLAFTLDAIRSHGAKQIEAERNGKPETKAPLELIASDTQTGGLNS